MRHSYIHFSLEQHIHRHLHNDIFAIPFSSFLLGLAKSLIFPQPACIFIYFKKLLGPHGSLPFLKLPFFLEVQYELLLLYLIILLLYLISLMTVFKNSKHLCTFQRSLKSGLDLVILPLSEYLSIDKSTSGEKFPCTWLQGPPICMFGEGLTKEAEQRFYYNS